MAAGYLPLAAALLATAVALLVATSAVPLAAATDKYSGRMVIIRAPGARVVSAGGALNMWQQRRLVEDEVAPELGGGQLGAGDHGIDYSALDKNKQVCLQKCALPGHRYTQGRCTYSNQCPQGPSAEPTRTVHA